MSRYEPNWPAFACGVAYVLAFLLLPVYNLLLNITGFTALMFNFVTIIPLLLGITMAICALLLDPKISIGAAVVTLLGTLIFSLLGNAVLSGNPLISMAISEVNEAAGMNITSMIPVRMGWGSVVCMMLCIAHIVLEVVLGSQKVKPRHEEVKWDGFDSGPGTIDF